MSFVTDVGFHLAADRGKKVLVSKMYIENIQGHTFPTSAVHFQIKQRFFTAHFFQINFSQSMSSRLSSSTAKHRLFQLQIEMNENTKTGRRMFKQYTINFNNRASIFSVSLHTN